MEVIICRIYQRKTTRESRKFISGLFMRPNDIRNRISSKFTRLKRKALDEANSLLRSVYSTHKWSSDKKELEIWKLGISLEIKDSEIILNLVKIFWLKFHISWKALTKSNNFGGGGMISQRKLFWLRIV